MFYKWQRPKKNGFTKTKIKKGEFTKTKADSQRQRPKKVNSQRQSTNTFPDMSLTSASQQISCGHLYRLVQARTGIKSHKSTGKTGYVWFPTSSGFLLLNKPWQAHKTTRSNMENDNNCISSTNVILTFWGCTRMNQRLWILAILQRWRN